MYIYTQLLHEFDLLRQKFLGYCHCGLVVRACASHAKIPFFYSGPQETRVVNTDCNLSFDKCPAFEVRVAGHLDGTLKPEALCYSRCGMKK